MKLVPFPRFALQLLAVLMASMTPMLAAGESITDCLSTQKGVSLAPRYSPYAAELVILDDEYSRQMNDEWLRQPELRNLPFSPFMHPANRIRGYEKCIRKTWQPDVYEQHEMLKSMERDLSKINTGATIAGGVAGLGVSLVTKRLDLAPPTVFITKQGYSFVLKKVAGISSEKVREDAEDLLRHLLAKKIAESGGKVNLLEFSEETINAISGLDLLGFSDVDPETLRLYKAAVRDVLTQIVEKEPNEVSKNMALQGFAKSAPRNANVGNTVKKRQARLREVRAKERIAAEEGKAFVDQTQATVDAQHEAVKHKVDWERLQNYKDTHLAHLTPNEAIKRLQAYASGGAPSADLQGLTRLEAKALSDDYVVQQEMRTLAKRAGNTKVALDSTTKVVRLLGGNVDYERYLEAASFSAETVKSMADQIANKSNVGALTMVEGFAMAGMAAGLISHLSGFGASQGPTAEQVIMMQLQKIMEVLQQIHEIALTTLLEQRESFRIVNDKLNIVLEIQADESLSGYRACQSVLDETRGLPGYRPRDIYELFQREQGVSDLSARAKQCRRWVGKWSASSYHRTSDGEGYIPSVLTFRLQAAQMEVKAALPEQEAQLRSIRDHFLLMGYPALMSLLRAPIYGLPSSDVTSATALLLSPPKHILDIDRQIDLARKNSEEAAKKDSGNLSLGNGFPVDLGPRLEHLGLKKDLALDSFISRPIATPVITDIVDFYLVASAIGDAIDENFNLLAPKQLYAKTTLRESNQPSIPAALFGEMDRYTVPALTAISQENLLSGHVILNAIDRLITHGPSSEKCPEKADPSSKDLCLSLGRKAYDQLYSSALTAVREFKVIARNLLLYRLRKAYMSNGYDARLTWSPEYSYALGSESPHVLRDLFKGIDVTPLKDDVNPSEDGKGKIRFYSKLSGECNGVSKVSEVGTHVCALGSCIAEPPRDLTKDQDIQHYERRLNNVCVAAQFPEAEVFALGNPYQTGDGRRLMLSLDPYLQRLSYFNTFSRSSPLTQWMIFFNVKSSN